MTDVPSSKARMVACACFINMLSEESRVDPRTVLKHLSGTRVRGITAARIDTTYATLDHTPDKVIGDVPPNEWEKRRLAAQAGLDMRTVEKALAGLPVRRSTLARIQAACALLAMPIHMLDQAVSHRVVPGD